MTRTPARPHFHRSRLLRTLVDLTDFEPSVPTRPLAETLGQWISFTDAIALAGVYGAYGTNGGGNPDPTPARRGGQPASVEAALVHTFAQARKALEQAIEGNDVPSHGHSRLVRPSPEAGMSAEQASDYAPYRRYHQAHQRHQEQAVGALRATLRAAAARISPQLKQLAALDAAYEAILGEREATLLATIPSLLEKRFHTLRRAHQHVQLQPPRADDPSHWMRPGGWLARYSHEMNQVLLAELDLRLQPAVGLLEAIHPAHAAGKHPQTHESRPHE